MLSFIAIGFLAVVCYVADSDQSFVLHGETLDDFVPHFRAHDGFLSDLTAGTYEFKLQTENDESFASESYWTSTDRSFWRFHVRPHWTFVHEPKKDLPGGRTDGIIFVLNLDDQAGCKLEYGDTYYLLEVESYHTRPMTLNKKMKYAARRGITKQADRAPGLEPSKREISVELKGDLKCPPNDTFVLIQGTLISDADGSPNRFYNANCRGGTEDYLKGEESTGIVATHRNCKAGRDVISGNWPEEITVSMDLPIWMPLPLGFFVRDLESFEYFVIVCRLYPNKICFQYNGHIDSKFKRQPLPESSSRGRSSSRERGRSSSRERGRSSSRLDGRVAV